MPACFLCRVVKALTQDQAFSAVRALQILASPGKPWQSLRKGHHYKRGGKPLRHGRRSAEMDKMAKPISKITGLYAFGLAATALTAVEARADYYLHHWEDRHEQAKTLKVAPNLSYYRTSTNYDTVAARYIPANMSSLTRIETDVEVAYAFHDRITAFGRLGWARLELDHKTAGGNTYGFTDQLIGLSARVWERRDGDARAAQLTLQTEFEFPLYQNQDSVNTGGPFIGDQTMNVTGGAFLMAPLFTVGDGDLFAKAGVAYQWRRPTSGYSTALPWSFQLGYSPAQTGLFANVSALGTVALQQLYDPTIAGAAVEGPVTLNAGGSYTSGSPNPTLITVRGRAGYQFAERANVSLAVSQATWGKVAPHGLAVAATFEARWGMGSKNAPKGALKDERPNKGFVNYSFEAHIVRTPDNHQLIKINKGSDQGVEAGQVFDIFSVRTDGTISEAVARAKVAAASSDEASLSILEYFKEVWIEEGFIAKRPLD